MKVILFLFVFFTIAGSGIGYSKFYAFHLILLILMGRFLLISLKTDKIHLGIIEQKTKIFLIFFFTWSAFSLLWSIDKIYTLQYLFYISNGILLIYFLNYSIKTIDLLKKVINVGMFSIGVEVVICLLEIFTSFRYPLSPYSAYASVFGRSQFNAELLNFKALVSIEMTPTGFMGNPNSLATTLTLFLPFFLILTRNRVTLISVPLILIVILYTGSRANLITALLIIVLYYSAYNLKNLIKFFVLIPILLLAYTPFMNFIAKSSNIKLQEILGLMDSVKTLLTFEPSSQGGSIAIRQTLIADGVNALINTNFIGVGGGAAKKIQELLGNSVTSMHNFWIELLVEGGVLLFISFIVWYFYLVIKLYFIYRRNEITNKSLKNISIATSLSLIGFIPGAISASSAIYLLPMWFVFAIGIAVIKVSKNEYESE